MRADELLDLLIKETVTYVKEIAGQSEEAIEAESSRALANEVILNELIKDEKSRAILEEIRLQGLINSEEIRAKAQEKLIQEGLSAEQARALANEIVLNEKIEVESNNRLTADTLLLNAINDETARAIVQEQVILDSIDQTNESLETVDNKLDLDVHHKASGPEFVFNVNSIIKTSFYKNIKTGATSQKQEVLQLADSEHSGFMPASAVTQIQNLTSRVENIEGQTARLLFPTGAQVTQANVQNFVNSYLDDKGRVPSIAGTQDDVWVANTWYSYDSSTQAYTLTTSQPTDWSTNYGDYFRYDYAGIAVVIQDTYHIWHYYANASIGWRDDGQDTVSQFTNSVAGIILGTPDTITNDVHVNDGKIFAEPDGTGSVLGWDRLTLRVSDIEDDYYYVEFTGDAPYDSQLTEEIYNRLVNSKIAVIKTNKGLYYKDLTTVMTYDIITTFKRTSFFTKYDSNTKRTTIIGDQLVLSKDRTYGTLTCSHSGSPWVYTYSDSVIDEKVNARVSRVTIGETNYDPISGVVTLPSAYKSPYAFKIRANNDSSDLISYDGSATKTFTVKPSTTAGAFIITDGTTNKTIQLVGSFTDNNDNQTVGVGDSVFGVNALVKFVQGTYMSVVADTTNNTITIGSTLQSKAAASAGTDVSLVTTGEKFTWNSKLFASQVATVESSSTASKAYAVGSLLVYNGILYKVATAISQGGTITPGTNVIASTVEGLLAEKQNTIDATHKLPIANVSGYTEETWTFTMADGTIVTKTVFVKS